MPTGKQSVGIQSVIYQEDSLNALRSGVTSVR